MAQQRFIDDKKNACPYCGKPLVNAPIKDTPCPFCGNIIYVRQSRYSKDNILTTSENLDKISGDWKQVNFIKTILKSVQSNGIKESDFNNKKQEMSVLDGKPPNDTDVLRAILTDLQKNNVNVYFQLAMLLNMERKDAFNLLTYAKKLELTNLKNSGIVKKVKIASGSKTGDPEACEACKKHIGKVFTIDEALDRMPIPRKDCTFKLYDESRGFCRCTYIVAF